MSLLGIDIGTTGCKAVAFSTEGQQLARAYRDYGLSGSYPGYAELNTNEVWAKIKETIREVALQTSHDPVTALSVSSLGEALVPVTRNRQVTGNSITGADIRGMQYIEKLRDHFSDRELFDLTGNPPGNMYSLPKLAWIKDHDPILYARSDYFLSWADFVGFMLGGEATAAYSLAGRTLMFDPYRDQWADKLPMLFGLDIEKLGTPRPVGQANGKVDPQIARELGLPSNATIVTGGHDQCCATLGSGISSGSNGAMLALGTFLCVVPVFNHLPNQEQIFHMKLPFEHHVVPGHYVTFIYNQSGGALVNWFRNTFASLEEANAIKMDFPMLFNEIPNDISEVIVLPFWGVTGPPEYHTGKMGTIIGLSLDHHRGDILKALLESMAFYVLQCLENPDGPVFNARYFTATGGGAVSNVWLQIMADVLGKPIIRNQVTESGALGAAIIAGCGSLAFQSYDHAISAMVKENDRFLPNGQNTEKYQIKYQNYKALYNTITKKN